ncbi:FG-GAP-like repeat-containing protein [Streptomyces sp. NPDC088915]|uniref:FG-GAP-like repeat-containing protein n=1 Tax=Streptomyces sp. NPDC088915 TaxID=3365912 RepID=UPI0037F4EC10
MQYRRPGPGRTRAGASALALALALAAAGPAAGTAHAEGTVLGSFEEAFNNTAVTPASASGENPNSPDFDGAGNSYSGALLSAAGWEPGAPITVNGTVYTWPRATRKGDNAKAVGQTFALSGRGDALGFLAAGDHGPAQGDGTVTYTDGTTSAYRLAVEGWAWDQAKQSAPAVTVTDKVFTLEVGSSSLKRPNRAGGKNVYAVTVPLDRAKTVKTVTLPTAPGLHVFSVGVRDTTTAPEGRTWTGSWGAALTPPEGMGEDPDRYWPVWNDQTLRMVVHPHKGGADTRLRFANTFGFQPVTLGRVTLAERSAKTGAATGTVREVTFTGGRTIPAGGELVSDPVEFPVVAGQDLLVSVHLPQKVMGAPVHSNALSKTYVGAGDLTGQAAQTGFTESKSKWTLLSGLDVETTGSPGTVVVIGDSQTDGAHSTEDANKRWPDLFAKVLAGDPAAPGVLNMGLNGNKILQDHGSKVTVAAGTQANLLDVAGPAALNRLDRDVFAQPGVRRVVLYEGVNDILYGGDGNGADAPAIKAGIDRIVADARARGIAVTVATVPPFGCRTAGATVCSSDPGHEEVRQDVNAHIRDLPDHVDLDRATRDTAVPTRLALAYKTTRTKPIDDLHFNDTGTQRLADTFAAAVTGTSKALSQTAAADFDGDGLTDLLARDATSSTLRVWFGRGDGSFDRSLHVTNDWNHTQTVAADFTGDGKADILAKTPNISEGSTAPELWMWPGRGNGHFGERTRVTLGWKFEQMAVADFDIDGRTDIIAAEEGTHQLKIWAGTESDTGYFKYPRDVTKGWTYTQTVAGDLNGDGGADIMATDANHVLTKWIRDPDGSFQKPQPVTEGWTLTETVVGDFTEDGKADIVARDANGTLKIWTGRGDATFNGPRAAPVRW